MKGCPFCTDFKEMLVKENVEFFDRDIDEYKDEYDLFVEITSNEMIPSMLIIEGDEKCDPQSDDILNCSQTTSQCVGKKNETRDAYGDCNSTCGCVLDDFTNPQCVVGTCGATCTENSDCVEGKTCTNCICAGGGYGQDEGVPELNSNNKKIVAILAIVIICALIFAFALKKK